MIHVTQGAVSIQPQAEERMFTCPAHCFKVCLMDHGTHLGRTVGEGNRAQNRVSYLEGQEAEELGTEWNTWRTEVYLGYLKARSLHMETQKGTLLPMSLFHSQS